MELLFPLLLVALLVPMFLGVRRQKREAEKVSSMQENLAIGDAVTTTSGLYGTVVDLDDETVDLEIAEDVVTTWLRQSIRDVRTVDESDTTPEDDAAELSESAADEPSTDSAEETSAPSETRLTKD